MKATRIVLGLGASLLLVLATVAPVLAQESNFGGGNVSGYAADQPIDNGRIVELTGEGANRVKVASKENAQNMFGVTVNPNQIPFKITNGLENEVFVAVSGTYSVLVSTEAGEIKSGDYVTQSSINGVAMAAGDEEVTVFGRANAGFNGEGSVLGRQALSDVAGGSKEVALGSVPVTINIQNNPNHLSTEANLPEMLERIGREIAQKEVNPIRIYISIGITVVSLIAAIAVMYAGVRNSVISIGRNPMSKRSIFRALIEVILTALLILIVGLFAVYLLLRL